MNRSSSDSHPDDEQLSTHLDAEGDPALAVHLAGCPSCRSRLEDLRAVAATLAEMPPGAGGARIDQAVAAARAAWADERRVVPAAPAAPVARPTPLSAVSRP
ncbi:MAG: ChrR family anti-sigma-E factor, partial [Acidimicrobiales bacterium]